MEVVTPKFNLPLLEMKVLCQKWKIERLSLFGSVLREDFGDQSDIDILLRFKKDSGISLFDLVSIKNEFEAILGREANIVTESGVERSSNSFFRQNVLETAQVVFDHVA